MNAATVFDTETTGLEEPDVIEIAWAGLDQVHPLSADAIFIEERRFKPRKPITLGAMAAHHIIDEDLTSEPKWPGFWMPPGEYLIGHNVDYDWKAIGSPPMKRICTLAFARSLWPELDSHSLGALTYHLGNREEARVALKGAHSAATDTYLCCRLLVAILYALPNVTDWESVWQASEKARVPKTMPYGKHRGTPIAEIPRDYKQWLLRQPDVDPYLAKALRA